LRASTGNLSLSITFQILKKPSLLIFKKRDSKGSREKAVLFICRVFTVKRLLKKRLKRKFSKGLLLEIYLRKIE